MYAERTFAILFGGYSGGVVTAAEASSIIKGILKDRTRLWRSKHLYEKLEERGFTIQDIWKLLKKHTMEGQPIPNEETGNFEVSLLGKCLDGRDTRLILGIRRYGPSEVVTIIDIKPREEAMKMTCPRCGNREVVVRHPDTYRYREAGLDGIILNGGVTEIECPSCRDTFVHIEQEQQLLQVIALMLLMKPGHLTGPEMRFLRRGIELSQAELAKALDVRRATIAERESKKNPALRADGEFFSRIVLLKSFLEYIKQEGNDHLSPMHWQILNRFCDHILKLTERVLQGRQRKTLQIRQVANGWKPEPPELVPA